MKNLAKLFAIFAAVSLIAVGCKPEPTPEPEPEPEPIPEELFKMEITEVTKSSVSFRITPTDNEKPYVAMIIDKAYFEEFDSEDAYIDDDLSWFEEVAQNEGLTLAEFLAERLNVGVLEASEKELVPNTPYLLYAYHLTYEGEVISDMEYVEFTTKSPEKVEISYEVEVSDITFSGATVNVTTSDPKAPYFVNVLSENDVEYFGGVEVAWEAQLVALRDYYLGYGKTPAEMIANLCFVGNKSLTVDKLSAGTKYYAYAMGVDEDFFANTEVEYVAFSTPTPDASDLTFEVELGEIFYDHAEGTVTPSNNEDGYICSIQLAESLDWYGSDEEFMETLVMDLEWWYGGVENSLHYGPTDLAQYAGLTPNTDYVVVCFGWDGAPNTGLFTFPFTTTDANGDPAELVVTMEAMDVTHNSMTIKATPSVGAYYFLSIISSNELDLYVDMAGGIQEALQMYADMEIDYGAYYFECTRAEYLADMGANLGVCSMGFNQLSPATEYIPYAVAVDMTTGELASTTISVGEPVSTTEKVVSDATVNFVFGDYYDGSELATLRPDLFLNCQGHAVLPYTVIVNDSAFSWYTSFSAGDYTEWGCTDDDIYDELITYGVEWGADYVSIDSEGGVAVLAYGEPYTFLGMAEDIDGNFGVGALEVVTLSKDGVSPAEEFASQFESAALPKVLKAAAKRSEAPKYHLGSRLGGEQKLMKAPEGFVAAPKSVAQSKQNHAIGKRFLANVR